jgi:ribosome-binding protein aMBF1 (putative translation factor)
MRTWEDFKNNAKKENDLVKTDIEEMETLASLISAIIERRNELGISQRELANICGLPHSSVARIESCSVKPNVGTMLKIMKPLGITLSVVRA